MPATSRIAEAARLMELEGRRQAIKLMQKETDRPNHALLEQLEIECKIRDAAPWLLAVAGKFQKGDALTMRRVANILGQSTWAKEYEQEYDCLRRMAEAAEMMEAEGCLV